MSDSRILGLDPGERRVGVALSDPLGMIASPLTVLDHAEDDVLAALRTLVEQESISTVVVGLPVGLSGEEGPAAQRARGFGREIEEELDVDVVYFDERFTTVVAESALLAGGVSRTERRERRDKVAAAVMLQGYLDAERRGRT